MDGLNNEYEKQIKDKRDKNKDKLKELGFVSNKSKNNTDKVQGSWRVKDHRKFTNPTSPMRSSSRLNKPKGERSRSEKRDKVEPDSDISGEVTRSAPSTNSNSNNNSKTKSSGKGPERQIQYVYLKDIAVCPVEQSVRYYHKQLAEELEPVYSDVMGKAEQILVEQYELMRAHAREMRSMLEAESSLPGSPNASFNDGDALYGLAEDVNMSDGEGYMDDNAHDELMSGIEDHVPAETSDMEHEAVDDMEHENGKHVPSDFRQPSDHNYSPDEEIGREESEASDIESGSGDSNDSEEDSGEDDSNDSEDSSDCGSDDSNDIEDSGDSDVSGEASSDTGQSSGEGSGDNSDEESSNDNENNEDSEE